MMRMILFYAQKIHYYVTCKNTMSLGFVVKLHEKPLNEKNIYQCFVIHYI